MTRHAEAVWSWSVPLLALLLMLGLWAFDANIAVFLWLNQALQPWGDAWWQHVTVLGDTAILLLILLFCGRKPEVVWQFALAALLAILWTQSMKAPLDVLRPPALLDASQFHLIGGALQHHSFPSGHTTTAFVVAGVIALQTRIPAGIRIVILLLATLIGLSRIACGVHWPLDVLGGALGGWLAAVAGSRLGRVWTFGLKPAAQRAFALFWLGVALWMVGRPVHDFPQTQTFQMALALLALLFSVRPLGKLFGLLR